MLNVSFNIAFIKMIFFSISHSFLHHLYLPYGLLMNQFNFVLLAIINILTTSRARWKTVASINIRAIAVSINQQILQNMIDSTAG